MTIDFHEQLDDQINKEMQPLKECPQCGNSNLKRKVSFKGRKIHRNKRYTQYCECGWSCIIPTEREAGIELGLID